MAELKARFESAHLEKYKRRKLSEYARTTLPDPLEDLRLYPTKAERRKAIRRVAEAVQHYGQSTTEPDTVSTAPRLLDPIRHDASTDSWAQLKRFRLCVHGANDFLQQGDLIHLLTDKQGIVSHFTMSGSQIQIHLQMCEYVQDMPADWRLMMNQPSDIVLSAESVTVSLGDIRRVTPKADVRFSDVERTRQGVYAVKRKESMDSQLAVVQSLAQGYILCRSRLLSQCPIVIDASRYIHVFLDPLRVAHWIRNDFQPFLVAIANDEEDQAQHDAPEYTTLYRMNYPESQCTSCRNVRRIVLQEGDEVLCEGCYVRIRYVMSWLPQLEECRQTARKTGRMPDNATMKDLVTVITDKLYTKHQT